MMNITTTEDSDPSLKRQARVDTPLEGHKILAAGMHVMFSLTKGNLSWKCRVVDRRLVPIRGRLLYRYVRSCVNTFLSIFRIKNRIFSRFVVGKSDISKC